MNLGGTIRLNRVGVILIIGVFILFLLYMNIRTSSDDKQNVAGTDASLTVNLRLLLIAAIEVAEKGGKEVVAVRSEPSLLEESKGKTKEGANIPVTVADLKSHCVMYYNLKRSFPKIEVISEEKAAEKDCATVPLLDLQPSALGLTEPLEDMLVRSEDVAVWIDPLDATQEYTEGLLDYVTTMVCVAVKGKPIIGVIHKPFGEKPTTSWAWVGRGVSHDLQHKTQAAPDDAVRLIVSRSHAGQVLNVSRQLFGSDVTVISAGGAGYKTLAVVANNATAYVHTTAIKKWDVCAGNAILSALGGSMTTLADQPIDYSTRDNPVNENGILGTVSRHDFYIDKFSKYKAT